MDPELEEKTRRLQQMLERESLAGVLLNAQHNFAWLTSGRSNTIDTSREGGAASLLVATSGKRYILANNIEMPRMLAEEVSPDDFEPAEYRWQAEKASAILTIDKARALLGGNVSSDTESENKIAACRYRLTAGEIDRYRLLGNDAGLVARKVIDKIAPGETEVEIAEKVRHELALGDMAAVVTLVAADERISQFRHPVPTANRWNKTLLIVVCAKRGGLIVSLSRMISRGEPEDDLRQKTDAAADVHASLLHATRPGQTGAELYQVAADAYAARGFDGEIDRHHQGGAAGYKTREWVAHPQSIEIVDSCQAFAWNPSITGTKVEETCIANDSGTEIITASPDFPQIASFVGGREYISPGILTI